MLRNILIVTMSGIPVFNKEFLNPIPQPRLIGGLLISMISASRRTLSRKTSYIELENVAITILTDAMSGLVCAVFHDVSDGYEFGKILASQILIRFEREYGRNPSSTNPQQYEPFHSKIPDVLRGMVHPILEILKRHRGIRHASLITSGNVLSSTNSDLSISANLRILISHSTDLMNSALDHPQTLRIEGDTVNIQIIHVEHLTHLVVVSLKNADQKKVDTVVNQASDLIRKGMCALLSVQYFAVYHEESCY